MNSSKANWNLKKMIKRLDWQTPPPLCWDRIPSISKNQFWGLPLWYIWPALMQITIGGVVDFQGQRAGFVLCLITFCSLWSCFGVCTLLLGVCSVGQVPWQPWWTRDRPRARNSSAQQEEEEEEHEEAEQEQEEEEEEGDESGSGMIT